MLVALSVDKENSDPKLIRAEAPLCKLLRFESGLRLKTVPFNSIGKFAGAGFLLIRANQVAPVIVGVRS